jgi:hypothetical protein
LGPSPPVSPKVLFVPSISPCEAGEERETFLQFLTAHQIPLRTENKFQNTLDFVTYAIRQSTFEEEQNTFKSGGSGPKAHHPVRRSEEAGNSKPRFVPLQGINQSFYCLQCTNAIDRERKLSPFGSAYNASHYERS